MAMFNSYVKLPEGSSTIQISSFKLPSKLPSGTVHKKKYHSNSYGKSWLIGGLEHGFYDFPYIVNLIIPTDELIFQRGRRTNHQPDNDFNG